jgi:hypothetical protein
MSLLVTLAAAMVMQLPQGTLRLDCGLADVGQNASAEATRLAITLEVGEHGIASADVEGPPLFFSRQGLMVFDAYPQRRGGSMNIRSSQPNRNQLRWTPHLDGTTIALTRQHSRISFAPDPAASADWRGTYDLGQIQMGDMTAEGPSGVIVCRRAAA